MILTVYNTCGINGDKTDWYIKCINTLLMQDYDHEVVVSSCLNSDKCVDTLKAEFGESIKVCRYSFPYIVNVTFNKTCIEFSSKKEYDAYFFVDSGVFLRDRSHLGEMAARLPHSSMVSMQTDTDTGYEVIGGKQNSSYPQVVGEDFVFPIGKAVNLHAQLFSKEIMQTFGMIIPDVFAAYCTESTFPFLNACVNKNWTIVKDIMATHNKAVDGPSSSQPHWSMTHGNPWNNLLYGRDARTFINDPEAIKAGLGYEECGKIMIHSEVAYQDGIAKYPDQLIKMVRKYFFSNKDELDYGGIRIQIV